MVKYSCSYRYKIYIIIGAEFLGKAYFGAGNGSIFLDDVICSGSESTILQCSHSSVGQHNCNHGEDVSVHCSDSGIEHYDILLYFVAVVVEESVDNVTVCSTEFDDQLWAAMR